MTTPSPLHPPHPRYHDGDSILQNIIWGAVTEQRGRAPENGIHLVLEKEQEGWIFGTVAVKLLPDIHDTPEIFIFLIKHTGDAYEVALRGTPLFEEWLVAVPETLISAESKTHFTFNADTSGMNGEAQLSLPFAVRETWRYTGGPHGTNRGAIDLAIAGGQVRAAREGTALVQCNGALIIVLHANSWETGYFHITNRQVNNNTYVQRGRVLGTVSRNVGTCAGSADGDHVHFSLRRSGADIAINGHDIGGWRVAAASTNYNGTMTRAGMVRTACSGSGCTNNQVWSDGGIGSACPSGQMQATYWNGRDFNANPVFWRCEARPLYDWGNGGPGSGIGNDNFSVRWAGIYDLSGATYRFSTRTDDGVRLWYDNITLIDQWRDMGATTYNADRAVTAGKHTIMMEYYENGSGAVAQVDWRTQSGGGGGSGNLALNRSAWATSQESSSTPPARANDGNTGTRWSSNHAGGDQWWRVDFGSAQSFNRVTIRFEAAYARDYFVGWSNDGTNFDGYWYNATYPANWIHNIGNRNARYSAVLLRTRAPGMANFSFWEYEVYNITSLNEGEDLTESPSDSTENLPLTGLVNIEILPDGSYVERPAE